MDGWIGHATNKIFFLNSIFTSDQVDTLRLFLICKGRKNKVVPAPTASDSSQSEETETHD